MKIVIIGGVAAGAKAAAKSRRLLPDAEIDIYTQDTHVSYSACGLPYYIQGNFEDWQKLIIRSVEEFEKSNIHIHLLNRVTKILPIDKKIIVKDLNTNELKFVDYDKLVIEKNFKNGKLTIGSNYLSEEGLKALGITAIVAALFAIALGGKKKNGKKAKKRWYV